MILMTSCKKDYTCACSYNNGIADVTQDFPMNNAKKKDATEFNNKRENDKQNSTIDK